MRRSTGSSVIRRADWIAELLILALVLPPSVRQRSIGVARATTPSEGIKKTGLTKKGICDVVLFNVAYVKQETVAFQVTAQRQNSAADAITTLQRQTNIPWMSPKAKKTKDNCRVSSLQLVV